MENSEISIRRLGERLPLVGALLVTLVGTPAFAQRRDGGADSASNALEITLDHPVRYGEVVVPARRYRLILTDGQLTLVDEPTVSSYRPAASTATPRAARWRSGCARRRCGR